ncbi:hypothetical protein H5410_021897, partial [Solanum commersonii]
MLLKRTYYFSYLVFKLEDGLCGLRNSKAVVRIVYSERPRVTLTLKRGDGWTELKMGNFFNDIGQYGDNEAGLMEIRHLDWKRSIIFQGIEFHQNEEEKDPPLTMLFVLVTFGLMKK